MKKIMFSDTYGLMQDVLEGRKTMTRRIATELNYPLIEDISEWGQDDKCRAMLSVRYSTGLFNDVYPHYQPGEIVAVAQSYEQIYIGFSEPRMRHDFGMRVSAVHHTGDLHNIAGWTNKMFVKANLMPNRIQITNVKYERLQDITEEDCLREGIQEYFPYIDRNPNDKVRTFQYFKNGKIWHRMSPAPECFALLIDDISGKGTWKSNPFVFVYEFELVR